VGVFTYKEIQDMLFKEKQKHQDVLDSANAQIDRDYSRHAVFIITDLQKQIKKDFIKKYS
tara:strand:- start:2147 stop:2326 length:180 start_codon:yes stop_codon:yes gene_type:complete